MTELIIISEIETKKKMAEKVHMEQSAFLKSLDNGAAMQMLISFKFQKKLAEI